MNVYCITFPNGKQYVGVENKYQKRFRQHRRALTDQLVHKAIRKYGWSNCKFEYLVKDKTPEQCWAIEKRLIAEWRLQDPRHGYNISAGGEHGSFGVSPSSETRAKIGRASRNRISNWIGKHHSSETKQKQSAAQIGKVFSLEHRKKMSLAHKGKKFSAEHRKNLSLSHKRRLNGI